MPMNHNQLTEKLLINKSESKFYFLDEFIRINRVG